jgi:hypothetical protein
MKTSLRTALVAALFATGSAFAGSTDSTSVRIISNGSSETIEVPLSELKVGESRQLAAASGMPAIVTRTDSGLTIEMAGNSTDIRLPDVSRIALADGAGDGRRMKMLVRDGGHTLDEASLDALLADLDADGKQVKIIRHEGGDVHVDGAGVERKVFVKRMAGDGTPIDEADLDALLSEIDVDGVPGDGKVIVVHRRKTVDSTD